MTYFKNLWLFASGVFRLGEVSYKPGWNAWKFLPLYLTDYFVNVLTGGAVESISRRAHRHRSGRVWDFLLDAIEKLDRGHGASAGPALWDSRESHALVQAYTTGLFFGFLALLIKRLLF